MQRYLRTIIGFLKPLGLPVYAGKVPHGAHFPYITLSAAYAPFCQSAGITLTAWYRESEGNARCVEALDRLCAMLPPTGVLLKYLGGSVMLHRPAADFIRLVTDAEDPRTVGGRMHLTARIYDL